jgi:cyanophycinase
LLEVWLCQAKTLDVEKLLNILIIILYLMDIPGVIIAIGGNEDKGIKRRNLHVLDTELDFTTSGILCRTLAELKSDDSPVEIITSASGIPEKVGRNYIRAFKRLGHRTVQVMHISDKSEAGKPDFLERISKAACIMFSGGDQFKLISALKDTEMAKLINRKYMSEEFVIAGTSAGAMAMPDLMIYPGPEPMNVKEKKVPIYDGLSLIHDVIIDTHFLVRGRFRRLSVAVANNPDHIGIGLEEDTGIIIRHGNMIEAIGSGLVTILDARNIQKTNPSVKSGHHEIFIENLLVHVLSHDDHFVLNRKKIT